VTIPNVQLFSLEEANELLARLRPLVERLVEQRRRFRVREERLAEIRGAVLGNGGRIDSREEDALRRELAQSSEVLADLVGEIHAVGAQVKDVDMGLLDFPARHPDGEVVMLCWRLGEDEIGFWHGLEDGFAGRKPLPF